MNKSITFSTYPSLQAKFKQICQLRSVSMTEKIGDLTLQYLNGKLEPLDALIDHFSSFKKSSPNEVKSCKVTISIDAEKYEYLKKLLGSSGIRPASFFTYIMSYAVLQVPQKEIYAREAKSILDNNNDSSIMHVVYGLEYFKPEVNAPNKLVHTELFYELCTEERFSYYQDIDRNCPLINVLAKHRNIEPTK